MTTEYSIESGEPIDAAPPPEQTLIEVGADQFDHLRLAAIVPSLTNPRKTFDAAKLAELAASIKASGVHQPILVRPLPGSRLQDTFDIHRTGGLSARPTHEIVSGERRYRACVLAGLATIPALIRNMTDTQVLEAQIVENLQRDDLSELEEAEGYEHLCQATGLRKEDVGAKIGKSRSYVYSRLKLLDLSFESKQALRAGSIDASRALLIARIPDSALQSKALAYATTASGYLDESPSVRALQTWLQQNVMLRLDSAPFDITSTQLCIDAGSCKVCPKRTGANPDLFADVSGADICTDPPCYQKKEEAHRARIVAQAEAKGMRVIDGKEAQEVMLPNGYGDLLRGYTRLDTRRMDIDDSGPTLRSLLGDALGIEGGLQPVLIEHPRTRELIEAVPNAEAEAMLITRGLIKTTKDAERGEKHIEELRRSIDARIAKESRGVIYTALTEAVHATPDAECQDLITPDLLRAWLTVMVDEREGDAMSEALNLPSEPEPCGGPSTEDAQRMHIARVPSAHLWRALAILFAQEDQHVYFRKAHDAMPVFDALATATAVDTQAVTKATRASIKAEVAQQIKAEQAKIDAAKPKPAADTARPQLKQPKPGKTSKEDAAQGIAHAMQAQLSVGFAVGQRVRITGGSTLHLTKQKYSGKEGTITQKLGDRAWMVTFKGRNGGLTSFDASEIEVVLEGVAA